MTKRIVSVLLGILSASCMYAESDLPLIHNVMAYETSSLAGDWNYIVDVQEEGYYDYRMNPTRWGFFNNAKPKRPEDLIEYDFDKSPTMRNDDRQHTFCPKCHFSSLAPSSRLPLLASTR